MKKIIAFAGRKRSGKGILSEFVKNNSKYSVIITIAKYLKFLCCDLLNIDYETLNHRKDNGYVFSVKPDNRWFNIINKKTNIDIDVIKKEIADIEFTNIRQMLQVIGTDLIRKYNPDWHVKCMVEDIETYSDDYVIIIDDVRFPNEREVIKDLGGKIFFIIRPNYFDVSNHISETSLVWQNFKDDYVIINDIQKDTLLEYFRIAYVQDFQNNNNNPIFLSANPHFKLIGNCDYPCHCNDSDVKEIIKQNINDIRFLQNGILRYHASNRKDAIAFNNNVLSSDCHNWQRDYIIYNPLINENLKLFINNPDYEKK